MNALTYGTFDFCHYGHINLLKGIRQYCDYVVVGLSTDDFNRQKGKESFYDYKCREKMLYDTGLVDLIIPEVSWDQKIDDIKLYNIDMFFMGGDWCGKFDFLNEYCKVIYLPRTVGISSTQIRGK